MAKRVNIHDAKTHLSRLVERAEAGETIVICRAGKPAAKLAPARSQKRPKFGYGKKEIKIVGDLSAPLSDDELSDFHDGPLFPK